MAILAGYLVGEAAVLVRDQIGLEYPPEDWLGWLNDAQREVVNLVGEANTVVAVGKLDAGVRQVLPPDAARLVDVPRNMAGIPVPTPVVIDIAAVDAARAEGDSGATAFTFAVSRTAAAGAASVDWAVAGSGIHPAAAADFVGGAFPGGTVAFADGAATATITVQVQGDLDIENDEAFTVTLSNPVNGVLGAATAVGTILNDDAEAPPPPPPPVPNLLVSTPNALAFTADFGAAYSRIGYPAGINPPFVSLASDRAGKILAAFNAADGLDMGFAWSVDYGQTWTVLDNAPAIGAADSALVRYGSESAIPGAGHGPRWVIFTTGPLDVIIESLDPLTGWTVHEGVVVDAPIVDMVYGAHGRWYALTHGPDAPLQSTVDFQAWAVTADYWSADPVVHLAQYGMVAGGRSLASASGGTLAVIDVMPGVGTTVIDTFVGGEVVLMQGPDIALPFYPPSPATGAICGRRSIGFFYANGLDATPGLTAATISVAGGSVVFENSLGEGNGLEMEILWNGDLGFDGDRTGLNGIDLFAGGATGFYVAFDTVDGGNDPLGFDLIMTVWDMAGFSGEVSIGCYPEGWPGGFGDGYAWFPFASFAADLRNVGAVGLRTHETLNRSVTFHHVDTRIAEAAPAGAMAYGAGAPLVIDGFDDGAISVAADDSFNAVGHTAHVSTASGGPVNAIGGVRDLYLFDVAITQAGLSTLLMAQVGGLAYGPDAVLGVGERSWSVGRVTWNGAGSPEGPFTGLLGADLTAGGGNGFLVSSTWNAGGGLAVALAVWSGDGAVKRVAVRRLGSAGREDCLWFPFADPRFAGLDFSNIGAVALEVSNQGRSGGGVDIFRVVVRNVASASVPVDGVVLTTEGAFYPPNDHWMLDAAMSTAPTPPFAEWAPMGLVAGRDGEPLGRFIGVPIAGRDDLPPLTMVAVNGEGVQADRFGRNWTVVDSASPAADHREAVQPVADDFVMISGGGLYRLNGGPWTAMPDAGADAGDSPRALVAIR